MGRISSVVTLTIPNGETESNIVPARLGLGSGSDMTVETPATLTGTVTLYGSWKDSAVSADMKPIYISGSDVTLAAGKIIPIPSTAWAALQVRSGSAEGAARVFKITIQHEM